MLERFGLDETALAVYRARLLHHEADDAALTDLLHLDEGRVAKATDLLRAVGLVVEEDDQLVAAPPEHALRRLMAQEERELDRHADDVRALRTDLADLADELRREQRRHRTEEVEQLRSPHDLADAAVSLAAGATSSITAVVAHRPAERELDAQRAVLDAAVPRGVTVRMLHVAGVRHDEATVEHLLRARAAGALVRCAPSLPSTFTVHDRTAALVATETADPQRGAVVLRTPGVVSALAALAEQLWTAAHEVAAPGATAPLPGSRTPDDAWPSPAEVHLLRLLAAGHTDESSARALQVSPRTVRRMVVELQRRSGSGSRFELAARAVDLGWLTLD